MRGGKLLSALSLGLWLVSAPAQAQDSAATTATALFKAGRADMKAGKYAEACPKLRESQRLVPAAGTLLNLAVCEEELGHLATAWQVFLRAAQMLKPGDGRVEFAKKRAAALEPRVPKLTVELASSAPKDARVKREFAGKELELAVGSSLGLALPVNPGTHRITVEASGYRPRIYDVEITEGVQQKLKVSVGAKAPEPEPEQAPPAGPPPGASPGPGPGQSAPEVGQDSTAAGRPGPWIWVAYGVGALGIATGMTTAVLANDKRDQADDECPNKQCSSKGLSLVDDGEGLATISYVGWGVGLVGLAVGTVLLLTGGSGAEARAPSSRWAGPQLQLFPRGGSVGYQGHF